jgi:hypothetical protein
MLTNSALCAAAAAAYTAVPTFIVGGDVHVVLSEVDGATVVAFRGTSETDIEDWLRDFDAIPADGGPLGTCHRGFLTGAQAALPEILARLPTDKPTAITGHSLGGALAVCMTGLLVARGITPAVCTTFGAPAVGTDTLARLIAPVPGERIWCGDDPVPFASPYQQDRPLTHIGHAMLDPIADHAIDRYAAALTLVAA